MYFKCEKLTMGHLKMDQPFELSTAACKLCFVHPLSSSSSSFPPPPPLSLRPYIKRDHEDSIISETIYWQLIRKRCRWKLFLVTANWWSCELFEFWSRFVITVLVFNTHLSWKLLKKKENTYEKKTLFEPIGWRFCNISNNHGRGN